MADDTDRPSATRERVEYLFEALHPEGKKQSLERWVRHGRHVGRTWVALASDLHNHGVRVSYETLRTWFPNTKGTPK